ncbi:hypothetical protein SAMN02910301_2236 [Lachnospiraceae bacterium XBD2001]|nr:hypothetical protein SAMN02910301_2236 [Lachnospiraceae bacterium XBD2001]
MDPLVRLTLKAVDLGFGIFNLFLYVLKKGVKIIDIAFLSWLSFLAPRVKDVAVLDAYYAICDKIILVFQSKALACLVVMAIEYILYLLFWKFVKLSDKRKDLTDVFKYIIALPVCLIVSIALYRYAGMITTNDAREARIFFYIVIAFIIYIHYISFIYEDFIRKPLSHKLYDKYMKQLNEAYQESERLHIQMKTLEVQMFRLDRK